MAISPTRLPSHSVHKRNSTTGKVAVATRHAQPREQQHHDYLKTPQAARHADSASTKVAMP